MIDETELLKREIESSPAGTFKIYRGSGTGLDYDINTSMNNSFEIKSRVQHANNNKCFIEVISLKLQMMDYWLRYYYVNKNTSKDKRKREFGALLEQCYKVCGLDKELYMEMKEFNRKRIEAIHGYVVGHIKYDDLEEVARNSTNTLNKLIIFVIDNCGEVISKLDGYNYVGDVIYHVPRLKASILNNL